MQESKKYVERLSLFLKEYLKKNKIGKTELANKTGLSLAEIRNMYDGKLKKVNMQNVFRIANYVGCKVEDMLGMEHLPTEFKEKQKMIEYEEPFYRYYSERVFDKVHLINNYNDIEYELYVKNAIHNFVEAHKYATGYYYNEISKEITKNSIDESIKNYRRKNFEDLVYDLLCIENDCTEENVCKEIDNCCKEENVCKEVVNNTIDVNDIGINIKRMRKHKEISREKMSTLTGISVDTLYRIENGKNKNINYENLIKISKVCNCTIDFLLGKSCDPVSDSRGKDVFYGLQQPDFIYKHVEIGHDLAYVFNYMDDSSKKILENMIINLNKMYYYRKTLDFSNKKKLSKQEVYFREQNAFKKEHQKRGIELYKREYME